jgi:hypothetical protein
MMATAPIVDAALPEEALARVPDVAPTLWNATKQVAARIPRGIGAMMPSAAFAAQDVADQGGSPQDQLKAASLTMAMGALPMLAQSGASSLPLRIAERGAKSAALAIPVSAFLNNLQDPSRRTTAGFTMNDVVSAVPQIVTGALTGGRELPFRESVEAPVTNPIWRDAKPPTVSEPFLDRMRAALDADAAAEAVRRSGDITFSKEQTPEERVGHAWSELGKDARTAVLGETPTEKDFPSILRKLAGSLSNEIEVSENRAPNGEVWAYQFTEPRNRGRVIILDLGIPGEAYVNSSMAGEHSTPIYQAIYAWAHNNGHRVVEDPVGLSKVAQLRRTSQMLSSAIRYGTTRHIAPGPHSGIQNWRDGEGWATTAHNIGLLARREAELVRERLPFVRQMRYVPKENEFYYVNQRLPAEGLDSYLRQRIAGIDPEFARGIGPATLKRALVTLAAERADLGGLGRLVGASSKETPLHEIRYGITEEPFPSATSEQASFSRHVAAVRSAALDEAGRLRTPPHIIVHRDAASIGNDYLRGRVQEENAMGRGKVNAFYHSGAHTIHLLADGVRDADHARAMVRHEALHAAIRKNPAFRSEYARLLRNLACTLPADARQRLEGLYGHDSSARIVEEYLARLAETDPAHSLWRQFITSFKLLASRFLGDRVHFNEADIREFIRRHVQSRSSDIASGGTDAMLHTDSAAVSDRIQRPLFSKPSAIKRAHAHGTHQ